MDSRLHKGKVGTFSALSVAVCNSGHTATETFVIL